MKKVFPYHLILLVHPLLLDLIEMHQLIRVIPIKTNDEKIINQVHFVEMMQMLKNLDIEQIV
jgi:hypothetical protein